MSEWFSEFFSNPIVQFIGFFGGVASIIAIPLAIYFYIKANKKRGLTYRVNEIRTLIVKGGEASSLTILHKNTEIVGDITAVHIAIWNQGHESIRPKHMLRPLIIETKNSVPILESRIRKMTRDVVELKLDESQCEQGQLSVSWNILETKDGGIVQIIYAGSPDIRITAYATLEGQERIIDHYSALFPLKRPGRAIYSIVLIMILSVSLELVPSLFQQIIRFSNSSRLTPRPFPPLWVDMASFISGSIAIIFSVITIFTFLSIIRQQKPPFEF